MIKKLKRIIVGIDISEKSNNVLKRALIIAKENKAELFVVHAVSTPWLSIPSYFASKELVIDKEAIQKTIEKKIKALNKDTKVSNFVFVKEGDADDVLLYASKLHQADMIVVGAHSKAKGRKRFLGTTAQKVAHKSHLPVLIVRNTAKQPYQNVIAPTDFNLQSKQSILFTKNIFPRLKIDIVNAFETVYIVDGPYVTVGYDLVAYNKVARSAANRNMKNFIKDVSVKKGKVIDGEFNAKEVLVKYINKGSYDLVVVGSRGTVGFNALLGSVSAYILRETKSDVLVYVPVD